ncbi:hypothetical protein NPX13_g5963 [Xylaria arbuscula]|uniref:PNPLA domain-containing protein n=1 Tax=Xylaria arbuscula TaxID=114810 RepID=A0A9W8ND56_9PEZI|nr:hypothetical protein NPX13_g5963 [Xylaria arbuscula]
MAGPSRRMPNLHNPETRDRGVEAVPGQWFQKIALSFDGGGVRGYWSLLVLQHLMMQIRDVEWREDSETRSSFHPCDEPDNVSQLANLSSLDNPARYTPFLPCHYFDYIGGTSTGALIAILLSRFRMTVEDCLSEYETMVGIVFGNPRMLHKMNTLTPRNKYSRKALKHAFQDVIQRRSQVVEDDTVPLFQTDIDTCRGSYTPYSEKKRRISQRNDNQRMKNPNEGMRIALLEVALAATAAPFYFGRYGLPLSTSQAEGAARAPTIPPSTSGETAHQDGTNISRAVTGGAKKNQSA